MSRRLLVPLTALIFALLAPAASAATATDASGTEGEEIVFTVEGSALDFLGLTASTEGISATAGTDYTDVDGVAPSMTSLTTGTVTVETLPDTTVETDETFRVVFSGGASPPAPVTGTIVDDEPVVGVVDGTFSEGAGTAQVRVVAARTSRDVSLPYSIAGDPGDVNTAGGTLNIPAGATEATIAVPLVNDDVDEDDETFTVNLGSQDGVGVLDPSATVTIQNDDLRRLSIGDVTATEGDDQNVVVRVPVTLNAPTHRTVTVQYTTFDLTARAPRDYLSRLGTVTIAPGQTSTTIDLAVVSDTAREGTEQFGLLIGNPEGAGVARAGAAITVNDDDNRASADSLAPNVRVSSLRRSGRTLRVRVSCPRNEQRCRGRATLYTVRDRRSRARALRRERRLGRKRFSLRGGQARTLRLRIRRPILRAARRAGRLRLQAFVVTNDGNGNTDTTTRRATLRF